MKIILLTHQRETFKKTNTGLLVKAVLGDDCDIHVWQRKQPYDKLLSLNTLTKAVLLFPEEHNNSSEDQYLNSEAPYNQHAFEYFVIIDSTWQQAQKIMNQSPYLQTMPKMSLSNPSASNYRLRRNQKENGLCTAEVVIHLLHEHHQKEEAEQLQYRFDQFNQRL